jgi:uncharacterized lipoprotein YbaY
MATISGKIVFEPTDSFSGATAYIRILDVSILDAPSNVVAESVLRGLTLQKERSAAVEYSIDCPPLNPNRSYTIEVHIDVSGTRNVTIGDYITMESYPVSPENPQKSINIKVNKV